MVQLNLAHGTVYITWRRFGFPSQSLYLALAKLNQTTNMYSKQHKNLKFNTNEEIT